MRACRTHWPIKSRYDPPMSEPVGHHQWYVTVRAWLSRGKLWDDVFTRMVANILAILFLGTVAAAVGVFDISPNVWAMATLLVGIILTAFACQWLASAAERKGSKFDGWMVFTAVTAVAVMITIFAVGVVLIVMDQ